MTIRPHPLVPAGVVTAVLDPLMARLRSDRCIVQRKSAGLDAAGAPVSGGFSTVASLDCQVKAAGRVAVERVFGGQFGPEVDYVISLPREADVRSDDQILVNGQTMQVVNDDESKSYGFELIVGAKAA